MSKTTAYITVFFGSLTAMIISAAILTPEIASGIVFVTVLLAIFTLIVISLLLFMTNTEGKPNKP